MQSSTLKLYYESRRVTWKQLEYTMERAGAAIVASTVLNAVVIGLGEPQRYVRIYRLR